MGTILSNFGGPGFYGGERTRMNDWTTPAYVSKFVCEGTMQWGRLRPRLCAATNRA